MIKQNSTATIEAKTLILDVQDQEQQQPENVTIFDKRKLVLDQQQKQQIFKSA